MLTASQPQIFLRIAELSRRAYAQVNLLRAKLGNALEDDPDYEPTALYQEHSR